MTTVFWGDDPDAWDTVGIDLFEFKNCATVSDLTYSHKLDVQTAPGTDGANIINKGYEPATVTVTLSLYSKELLELWDVAERNIAPRPGKSAPKARSVTHPSLTNIKKFYITKITKNLKDQIQEVKIDFTEFFQIRKSTTTVKTSDQGLKDRDAAFANKFGKGLVSDNGETKAGPPPPPSQTGATNPLCWFCATVCRASRAV